MATVTQDYFTHEYGYDLLVPAGSETTHLTACGYDENYNFVKQPTDIKYKDNVGQYKNVSSKSALYHDLFYYGVNVPNSKVN